MSESLTAVGISGSPSTRSRSRILLEYALASLGTRGISTDLIDLNELPADALVPTGVYAVDAEFEEGVPHAGVLERIERAVAESVQLAERAQLRSSAEILAVTPST